jgi:hypothetical protein
MNEIVYANDQNNGYFTSTVFKDGIYNKFNTYLADVGSNLLTGIEENIFVTSPNTANKAAAAYLTYNIFTAQSDLANADANTATVITLGLPGMSFNTGAPCTSPVMSSIGYGNPSNPADSVGLRMIRRRGNGASRQSLEANDYIANIEWRGAQLNGAAPTGNRYAKIGAKVDNSYTTNTAAQPVGLEFIVVSNTANIAHNFYANGEVSFAGALTANGTLTANGNILAGNVYANAGSIGANFLVGTLVSCNQPNITSVGTLTTLDVNGNISLVGAFGHLTAVGNITSNNITANNWANANNMNVTANISAGNVKTDNLLYANGTPYDLEQPGGSNTNIQFNDIDDFGGSNAFTFNKTTNAVSLTGNLTTSNANLGNLATANFVTGTLTTNAQPNITSVGNLISLDVTGNISANNITATQWANANNINVTTNLSAGNIKTDNYQYANGVPVDFEQPGGSNTNIQFNDSNDFGGSNAFTFDNITNAVSLTGNLTTSNANLGNLAVANFFTGTLTTNAQPNITSVGNLTDLRVNNTKIHLGDNAGANNQGNFSIAIGNYAGQNSQGNTTIALGHLAGYNEQGDFAIAIGYQAGNNDQGNLSIAIGYQAGLDITQLGAVAIGYRSGNQGKTRSTAVGYNSGSNLQQDGIAIGSSAGINAKNETVSIGLNSGTGLGNNSIAIGSYAAPNSGANNTITLNATGANLFANTANTFVVKPIRNAGAGNLLNYDVTTGEITYATGVSITSVPDGNITALYPMLAYGNGTQPFYIDNLTANSAQPLVYEPQFAKLIGGNLDFKFLLFGSQKIDLNIANGNAISFQANANANVFVIRGDEVEVNKPLQLHSANAVTVANITGAVGYLMAVSDQNGQLAYYNTGNVRWEYVANNSPV